ncbi:MAG TPA: hypothetical protein VNF04_03525, partial [Stellaceae bacterium]|nr:hypothetical protein [Stellaceae bacterium]
VDALVPQPFVLIGTSMDGIIAMAYAAGHKARLKRGELVAVPAVGHAPTLVEPAALAAIERFIAAV